MSRSDVKKIADLLTEDPDILNEMLPLGGRDPLHQPKVKHKPLGQRGKDPSKIEPQPQQTLSQDEEASFEEWVNTSEFVRRLYQVPFGMQFLIKFQDKLRKAFRLNGPEGTEEIAKKLWASRKRLQGRQ